MKIVLATGNQGKVNELGAILDDLGVAVLSLKDFPQIGDIVEDGSTFEENAIIKARTVSDTVNMIAVADDSGLEVDYLDGAPGIFSARFAGEGKNDSDNNRKLLSLLEGVPDERRGARFRCVIAISTPQGELYTTEGICEGLIGHRLEGDKGFGYDPLFFLPQYNLTFAQLDLDLKNRISHRGRALAKAKTVLKGIIERIGENHADRGSQ